MGIPAFRRFGLALVLALAMGLGALVGAWLASLNRPPCALAQGGCPVEDRAEFSQGIDIRGGTAFTITLTGTPTANRTITLPDADGTVVLDTRQVLAGTGLQGGGPLSADVTLSIAPTYALPQTCTAGQVPTWDAGTSTWVCGNTGTANAYALVRTADGLQTASASGEDTLTFRAGGALSVSIADNDATYGDYVQYSVVTSPATSTVVVGVDRAVNAGTGLTGGGTLANDVTLSIASTYQLPQGCADGETAIWDATVSLWLCAPPGITDAYTEIKGDANYNNVNGAHPVGQDTLLLQGGIGIDTQAWEDHAIDGDKVVILLEQTYRLPQGCTNGQVPVWDASTSSWACGNQTGLASAYTAIYDGTTTASASGADTIRFRSDGSLNVYVADNDPTYGDFVDYSIATTYRLPQGCADQEVPVWDATLGQWTCGAGGGGSATTIEWPSLPHKKPNPSSSLQYRLALRYFYPLYGTGTGGCAVETRYSPVFGVYVAIGDPSTVANCKYNVTDRSSSFVQKPSSDLGGYGLPYVFAIRVSQLLCTTKYTYFIGFADTTDFDTAVDYLGFVVDYDSVGGTCRVRAVVAGSGGPVYSPAYTFPEGSTIPLTDFTLVLFQSGGTNYLRFYRNNGQIGTDTTYTQGPLWQNGEPFLLIHEKVSGTDSINFPKLNLHQVNICSYCEEY